MERKNFNYRTASVDDIFEHFKSSSRQTISSVRANWKHDAQMTKNLDEAYLKYKMYKLEEKLSPKGPVGDA